MANMNHIARLVTLQEAGKQQVSVAQVKEILGCFCHIMYVFHDDEIVETIRRIGKKRRAKEKRR